MLDAPKSARRGLPAHAGLDDSNRPAQRVDLLLEARGKRLPGLDSLTGRDAVPENEDLEACRIPVSLVPDRVRVPLGRGIRRARSGGARSCPVRVRSPAPGTHDQNHPEENGAEAEDEPLPGRPRSSNETRRCHGRTCGDGVRCDEPPDQQNEPNVGRVRPRNRLTCPIIHPSDAVRPPVELPPHPNDSVDEPPPP